MEPVNKKEGECKQRHSVTCNGYDTIRSARMFVRADSTMSAHLGQVTKSGAKTPVWTRFKCNVLPADSCSAAFGVHGVPSDGDAACVAFAISACVAGDAVVVVAAAVVVGLVPSDAGS